MDQISPAAGDAEASDASGSGRVELLYRSLNQGLVKHEALVERLVIGLLSGGHILIEGPPGLAKTRAVKRLADVLHGTFGRIQCTPDLMPSDLTGTQMFRKDSEEFEFIKGPIFHSLVLVDEINRAPPKVQSALLEAMGEGQATAAGTSHALPKPFMVVATQNSIEHEGTYPLPEAQLDRFLMHVLVDFPDSAAELDILNLVESEAAGTMPPIDIRLEPEGVLALQAEAAKVHLSPALKDFIVRLVMATRDQDLAPDVREAIEHPVSPRGTLALAACVRARAMLQGRDFGTPEDVVALAPDVLAHRLVPTWRAIANGDTARHLVGRLLEHVTPL